MSTITAFVLIAVLALIFWWRPVLKLVAVTVIILASVGATEVVAAVVSGLTPN